MTNYNERLSNALRLIDIEEGDEPGVCWIDDNSVEKAKQAIASLTKELVAEAKPAEKDQLAQSTVDDESRCRFYRYGGYNFALNQFEQNLLKALEEV